MYSLRYTCMADMHSWWSAEHCERALSWWSWENSLSTHAKRELSFHTRKESSLPAHASVMMIVRELSFHTRKEKLSFHTCEKKGSLCPHAKRALFPHTHLSWWSWKNSISTHAKRALFPHAHLSRSSWESSLSTHAKRESLFPHTQKRALSAHTQSCTKIFLEHSGCRTRQPRRTWLLGPGAVLVQIQNKI